MPEIMVAGVKPMKVWLLAATRSRCGRIFFDKIIIVFGLVGVVIT